MTIFDRTMFADPDKDDTGIFMDGLGRAVVIWVLMQNRVGVTVLEAATAFNTTPEVICEACEDVLELDGD